MSSNHDSLWGTAGGVLAGSTLPLVQATQITALLAAGDPTPVRATALVCVHLLAASLAFEVIRRTGGGGLREGRPIRLLLLLLGTGLLVASGASSVLWLTSGWTVLLGGLLLFVWFGAFSLGWILRVKGTFAEREDDAPLHWWLAGLGGALVGGLLAVRALTWLVG